MARYMDKEKAESARRSREHLAKLRAYQKFEKERMQIQRGMHNEHLTKHRAYEKTLGRE